MIRECTEAENRVLKECSGDILIAPETYKRKYYYNTFVIILGMVLGAAAGLLLALWLGEMSDHSVETIIIMCVGLVTTLVITIRNLFFNKENGKNNILGDKFRINGGTIICYSDDAGQKAYMIYAEDDRLDTEGKFYCIKYPVKSNLQLHYGDRILLLYCENGAYIPMKVSGRTMNMISNQQPDYFYKTDWNTVECLPHPNGVSMDKTMYQMNEHETKKMIRRTTSYKVNRLLNWIGIPVIPLFILGISDVFRKVNDRLFDASTLFGKIFVIVIWVGGSIWVCGKLIYCVKVHDLKKIKYRKTVLFHSIHMERQKKMNVRCVSVYEYKDGKIKLVSYPFQNAEISLQKMRYGSVLCKYSEASYCMDSDWVFGD